MTNDGCGSGRACQPSLLKLYWRRFGAKTSSSRQARFSSPWVNIYRKDMPDICEKDIGTQPGLCWNSDVDAVKNFGVEVLDSKTFAIFLQL